MSSAGAPVQARTLSAKVTAETLQPLGWRIRIGKAAVTRMAQLQTANSPWPTSAGTPAYSATPGFHLPWE